MSDFDAPQNPFEDDRPKKTLGSDDPQSTFADEEPKPSALVIHDRTWQEIWKLAITSPSLETYTDILRDRNVDLTRALTWLYVAAVISYIFSIVASVLLGTVNTYSGGSNALFISGGIGIIGLICAPILALLGVAILMIPFTIVHVLARYLLGGKGEFAETIFALAAFYAPLTIIGGILSFLNLIPVIGYIVSIGLYLYMAWLGVVAMMAAHQFGWLQGAVAWLTLPVLLLCCIIAILIIALSTEGTDEIFQDIINTLEATPRGQ